MRERSTATSASSATGSRALPWALFASVFAALAVSTGFQPITSDASQMCEAADSLIVYGVPSLSGASRPDVIEAPDGAHFTKYPLMTVLGCVPAVLLQRAGQWLGGDGSALERYLLGLTPSCYAALGALGFFFLACALGFAERLATLAAALLVFTTPIWHYARSMYSENLQVTVVIWTVYVWILARERSTPKRLLLGGLLLGVAVNLKVLLFILPCAVLLDRSLDAWDPRRWARFVCFAGLGATPGLLAFLWYNHLRYGAFFALGYATGRDGSVGFASPLFTGLHGLFLSPGKSVFLYAPLLLLGGTGLRSMRRECPRNLVLILVPAAFVIVAVAKWWCWSGDVAWGPRLVVPVIPLLFVPVLWSLADARRSRRALSVALAGCGFYVALLGVAVRPFQYINVAKEAVGGALGGQSTEDVRDDLALLHFVPELSPIAGHHWLLMRNLKHEPFDQRSYYPWRSMNIRDWRVRSNPDPEHLNFWFAHGVYRPALIANLLGLACALYWLVSCLRRVRA